MEVFDKIKQIIMEQLDTEEEKVIVNASFIDDLGADSLDIVELIMAFEDEFQVEISDDQIQNIKTVGDVVRYFEN